MSNAQKARSWLPNFQLVTTTANAATIEHKVVAAGETIEPGFAVALDTGELVEAEADSGTLYGIALAGGSGGDIIPVAVGDQSNVFMGQCDDDIDGVAFPRTCDIVIDGDGKFLVDIGATAEDVLMVTGPVIGDDPEDDDVPPRVYFKILRSSYNGLVAAK